MQWTKLLLEKIDGQAAYADRFERRYQNKHVLPFIAAEYREVYGARADAVMTAIDPPRVGMAGITVDALTDRLTVQGASSDDPVAARVVEEAWEANDLDVMHREAHREAFIGGRSFAQIDRAAGDNGAVVGIESCTQMAVHRQSAPPYDVNASLKVTQDEWSGEHRGRLYLLTDRGAQRIDLREGKEVRPDPEGSPVASRWVAEEPVGTGFPWVPVVEFASRPRLLQEPSSEIEPIVSLVDIADLIEGLMVFAGHFGAVPIRWASGLDVMRDPKDPKKPLLGADGKPLIGFNPRADHMWVSTAKDAKFGQLEPASLASFVTWAEHMAARIRAKTSVASTYYSMDLKSHMSAELLKTDEAPMVRRVNSIGRDGGFGQAWRRVDRMLLAIERPDLARVMVRPRWVDPQTRIEGMDADRFSKLVSHLGPATLAQEVLGWSPAKAQEAVREAEKMRAQLQNSDPMVSLLGKPMTGAAASDG